MITTRVVAVVRRYSAFGKTSFKRAFQAIFGAVVMLGAATAAPITYVVDVDYSNGDQLFGVFDYDATTNTLSDIALFLTDSSGATINTFTDPLAGAPTGPSIFFFVDAPIPTPLVSKFAAIALDGPLTELGGTFSVLPGNFDPFITSFVATCLSNFSTHNDCDLSLSFTVFATGGTVTGVPDIPEVPLPAAAPLFLAGAGIIAILRRRWRKA